MKKTRIFLFALITLAACHKGVNTTPVAPIAKPTASFAIPNQISSDMLLEGRELQITNASKNADSYLWDFGNGVTSTDAAPAGISFVPCGGEYTISLTVTNKAGSNTYSQHYSILCSGKSSPAHLASHSPTGNGPNAVDR